MPWEVGLSRCWTAVGLPACGVSTAWAVTKLACFGLISPTKGQELADRLGLFLLLRVRIAHAAAKRDGLP